MHVWNVPVRLTSSTFMKVSISYSLSRASLKLIAGLLAARVAAPPFESSPPITF